MRKTGRAFGLLLTLAAGISQIWTGSTAFAATSESFCGSVAAETVYLEAGSYADSAPANDQIQNNQDQNKSDRPIIMYGSTVKEPQGVCNDEDSYDVFSEEYMSSVYYDNLQTALDSLSGKNFMESVLEVGLSQSGYKNYAVYSDDDVEALSAAGLLWTGAELRSTSNGNTEYTRWMQRYVMHSPLKYQYVNQAWCAYFASWCMYQAGYYSGSELRGYYYSTCADPRVESPGSLVTAFNFDQNDVWYTSLANKKLEAYSGWNTFVNTDYSAYDIPYKPGGLIFFSWDGSGTYFDHVAIVIKYDAEKHMLIYLNGNSSGQVKPSSLMLDNTFDYNEEGIAYTGADVIMAYAEYDSRDPKVTGEWHKNAKGWWYSDSTGWYPVDQWMCIDGKNYHFNSAGYLDTSCYVDGYWVNANGTRSDTLTASWKHNSKGWWYEDTTGSCVIGWMKIDGKWYYFDEKGYMVKNCWVDGCWLNRLGVWSYRCKGSWVEDETGKRFGDTSGWYAAGEVLKIDGVIYTFSEEGYLSFDPVITGTWHKSSKGWWFTDADGWYPADQWVCINGRNYHFNEKGYMDTSCSIDGYQISASGIAL